MTQNTPTSSLTVLKAAKSVFFKTVFVSVSMLALGSVSAYAEQAPTVKKIFHFPGYGDAIHSTDVKTGPILYSMVTPETEWPEDNTYPIKMYKCTVTDKNPCAVKLGKVETTNHLQPVLNLIWTMENSRMDFPDEPGLLNNAFSGNGVSSSGITVDDSLLPKPKTPVSEATGPSLEIPALTPPPIKKIPIDELNGHPGFGDPGQFLEWQRRNQELLREREHHMQRMKCAMKAIEAGIDPKICFQ